LAVGDALGSGDGGEGGLVLGLWGVGGFPGQDFGEPVFVDGAGFYDFGLGFFREVVAFGGEDCGEGRSVVLAEGVGDHGGVVLHAGLGIEALGEEAVEVFGVLGCGAAGACGAEFGFCGDVVVDAGAFDADVLGAFGEAEGGIGGGVWGRSLVGSLVVSPGWCDGLHPSYRLGVLAAGGARVARRAMEQVCG
jgi:hypothetical protein